MNLTKYPEGWIDPDIFGSVMFVLALLVILIVTLAMLIKGILNDWEEEDERQRNEEKL